MTVHQAAHMPHQHRELKFRGEKLFIPSASTIQRQKKVILKNE